MGKVHFTNKALEDLSDIWNYTEDLWGEEQADKYYYELIAQCNNLIEKPMMHKVRYFEVMPGLWGIKKNRHIIFFKEDSFTEDVLIIRILHQRMDVKTQFTLG